MSFVFTITYARAMSWNTWVAYYTSSASAVYEIYTPHDDRLI